MCVAYKYEVFSWVILTEVAPEKKKKRKEKRKLVFAVNKCTVSMYASTQVQFTHEKQ